ncbi:MAG: hypothetical protein EBU08_22910, partial [Micrococcales bacterium]|nr:hypothetical protein [Micrococcales bacterium]
INELTTTFFSYSPSNGFNPGSGTGAVAADYSRYQLPAQPANYLSNVSSQTICSGNPVVLNYADAPAGATITWVGSDGSSITGNPVTVYPTTNTLYTAYITGASTCSYIAPSIAVFIQNASVSIVPSSGANCALLTQSYSLSGNFPSGSTIQWTASGGTAVGPSNGTTFTVDWGNSPGNNLSVSVSVVDPLTGCTSSALLSLRPCCPIEPGMIYLNGTENPIDASTVAWVPGQSYALDGSMVVPAGANVTLNNNHLAIDPTGNIYIETGATLAITNSSLLEARCDTLWQGITVEGSGNVLNQTPPYGNLVVNGNSTIKDADTAVLSRRGGQVRLENATLRLNYKGVVLQNFNNNSSSLGSG